MKLLVVLLLVGIVSCDIDLTSGSSEVPCLKNEYGVSALDSPYATSPRRSIFPGIGGFDFADQTSSFYGGDAYSGYMPGNLAYTSAPALCARHHLVRRVRPVIEERYRNVPTVKNYVRNKCVYVTQKRPVIAKDVGTAETSVVRHVPVLKKSQKVVIDSQTSSVPIVRKRVVPVVEKYIQHVPVMIRYYRPIVDEDQADVTVLEKRIRPVTTDSVNHVPVTERRIRPVVESKLTTVPVKENFVRNVCDSRIHTAHELPLTVQRTSYPPPLYSPYDSPYMVGPYGSPVAPPVVPPVAPSVVPPVAPSVAPISAVQPSVIPDCCSPLAKGQNFFPGYPCSC